LPDRPVIAITKPDNADFAAFLCVATAVRLAGGAPKPVTAETRNRLGSVDGLLLGGGQDVFPMHFDDTPKQGVVYDEPRDEMDMALAARAHESRAPVLGICRGAQLMNVVRGGSLHLDMAEAYEDADYPSSVLAKIFYRKSIETEEGSIVHRALGQRCAKVNSLHTQSVKELGEGLAATACEKNGVVQAIEDETHPFFLGVQFHPEFLIHRRKFRRIFELFVDAAARSDAFSVASTSADNVISFQCAREDHPAQSQSAPHPRDRRTPASSQS